MLKIAIIGLITAVFLNAPSAFAAQYFNESSGLLFQYSDEYSSTDITESYNADRPKSVSVESAFEIGPSTDSNLFLVTLQEQDLFTVVESLRLRQINTDVVTNRDILGVTAVELNGSSFVDDSPIIALLLSFGEQTLVVLYHGDDKANFDSFIAGMRQTSGFADALNHPLQDEIADVVKRDIFSGYTNEVDQTKTFRPDQGINRAEFLKVLVLASPGVTQAAVDSFYAEFKPQILSDDQLIAAQLDQAELEEGQELPQPILSDVDREAWFAPYIFYAYQRKWIQGYPDGTFRPTNLVNIAEALKVILASRELPVPEDTEVWFRPYFQLMTELNVLLQWDDSYQFSFSEERFFSYTDCTRAQAAGFLSRLLWLNDNLMLDRYAKLLNHDEIPILLPTTAGDAELYQLGNPGYDFDQSEDSFQLFNAQERQLLVTIVSVSSEIWSDLERNDERPEGFEYLDENEGTVYLIQSECQPESKCAPQSVRDDILPQLTVKRPLIQYRDENISITYSHSESLSTEASQQDGLETLTLTNASGSEILILSFFSGRGGEVQGFNDQDPLRQRGIGDRNWAVYVEGSADSPRLSFVTALGPDLLVASIRGIKQIKQVSDEVMRILRTVGF